MIMVQKDHFGESRDVTGEQKDQRGSVLAIGEGNQGHCREKAILGCVSYHGEKWTHSESSLGLTTLVTVPVAMP